MAQCLFTSMIEYTEMEFLPAALIDSSSELNADLSSGKHHAGKSDIKGSESEGLTLGFPVGQLPYCVCKYCGPLYDDSRKTDLSGELPGGMDRKVDIAAPVIKIRQHGIDQDSFLPKDLGMRRHFRYCR